MSNTSKMVSADEAQRLLDGPPEEPCYVCGKYGRPESCTRCNGTGRMKRDGSGAIRDAAERALRTVIAHADELAENAAEIERMRSLLDAEETRQYASDPKVHAQLVDRNARLDEMRRIVFARNADLTAELARATAELATMREDRDEWQRDANTCDLRADAAGKACEALRAIIAGREVAPTDAEVEAHAGNGWRCVVTIDGELAPGLSFDIRGEPPTSALRGFPQRKGSVYVERWWCIGFDGRPCAWPAAAAEAPDAR